MSDIVIRAEHLSKMYRLGVINNGTLWKDLQTWVALKTGKEDPHSKIGEDKYAGDKDHFWALKDLNFEIKRGDRVGIIGKNGAGKSTLLKILSRITAPTEGRIKIKGKVASLLEVGTGFHGELTGRENIYLNGAILGMKKRQIDRKLDEIIDFSGIEHHIDTPVKRYSSGMYVRLAFAVAAHLDSDILIADEVLAVGDAEFQKKALGKMQDLSTGQGRTVLFVSHQMNAVKNLCSSGILLQNGKVESTGAINAVVARYLTKSNEGADQELSNWKNEYFTLVGFDVENFHTTGSVRLLQNDKDYVVRVSFNCHRVDPMLNIGIAIYMDSGELLFWSFSTDQSQEEWPALKTGLNSLVVPWPKLMLNEGNYQIRLMASIHFNYFLIDPEEACPFINVQIRGGLSESPYWYEKRPGICAPRLVWQIGSR